MLSRITEEGLFRRISHSRLRIQHLHMITALVAHGSVREAAAALGLTQPAVTKSLKELESLLEVPLFHREPRGLRPTRYCAPLERFARDTVLALEEATASIAALVRGEEGKVRVGTIGGDALHLAIQAIARLKYTHPTLAIGLVHGTTGQLLRRLEEGQLDFALAARSREFESTKLLFAPIARMPLRVIACEAHPLVPLQPVTRQDLMHMTWVLPPAGDPMREAIYFAFTAGGDPPLSSVIETESMDAALELVARSQVLGVLAGSSDGGAGVVPLDTTLDLPSIAYGLATPERRRLGPGAAALLATLEAEIDAASRHRDRARLGDLAPERHDAEQYG